MSSPDITIVDEKDQPIGAASIPEAQEKGLIHRVVRIMLEDEQGNILLQKRVPDARIYPGCWDNSAAGHVDVGESYEVAARRELKEEIGVMGIELREVGYYEVHSTYEGNKLINRFIKAYKAKIPRDTKFSLQPEEVTDVQWFSVAEARQFIQDHPGQVTDGVVEVLERFY